MSNALIKKSKSESTTTMLIGIVCIVVLTILCYIGGYLYSQSDSFIQRTAIHFIFQKLGFRYFASSISMIVSIIMYIFEFKKIASRTSDKFSFIQMDGGSTPYVYNGWAVFACVTGLITAIVGFIIHCIAFSWQLKLVKPLMIGVLIVQGILSGAVFALPFCKPLKRA